MRHTKRQRARRYGRTRVPHGVSLQSQPSRAEVARRTRRWCLQEKLQCGLSSCESNGVACALHAPVTPKTEKMSAFSCTHSNDCGGGGLRCCSVQDQKRELSEDKPRISDFVEFFFFKFLPYSLQFLLRELLSKTTSFVGAVSCDRAITLKQKVNAGWRPLSSLRCRELPVRRRRS